MRAWFLLIVFWMLIAGCSPECEIVKPREYVSPDTQHGATIYAYTCHNTTGLDWYADLRRTDQKLHHPGNVMYFGLGDYVSHMSMTWVSSTQLIVGASFDQKHIPNATNIDGVNVAFKRMPESDGTQQ